MKGDVLAIGIVSALAVAAGSRGSAAKKLPAASFNPSDPYTYPYFVSGSKTSYYHGPRRDSWACISASTAVSHKKSLEEAGYKRVDWSSTLPRNATLMPTTYWLTPEGELADDVEIEQSLTGQHLTWFRGPRIRLDRIPDEKLRRRIETMGLREKHGIQWTHSDEHRAALTELMGQISGNTSASTSDWFKDFGELAWLYEHPRRSR